jgi:hypothetical protein
MLKPDLEFQRGRRTIRITEFLSLHGSRVPVSRFRIEESGVGFGDPIGGVVGYRGYCSVSRAAGCKVEHI